MLPTTPEKWSTHLINQKQQAIKRILIPSRQKELQTNSKPNSEDSWSSNSSQQQSKVKRMFIQRYEILDDQENISEDFNENVIIPYFKDIYLDLAKRSHSPECGIDKFTIIQVRITLHNQFLDQSFFYSIPNFQEQLVRDFSSYLTKIKMALSTFMSLQKASLIYFIQVYKKNKALCLRCKVFRSLNHIIFFCNNVFRCQIQSQLQL
eukprot:403365019